MHYGFRVVEDLIDGLSNWMDEHGHRTLADVRGRALPNVVKWEELDLNYHLLAHIDQDTCIKCELCWTACEDGAHQAIRRLARDNGGPVVEIIEEACVGCNLCAAVCPVQGCITMERVPNDFAPVSWKEHAAGRGQLAPRSEHFHTATWRSGRK
jgi:dihydropyrimidine dehydrogenase (NAD+) subunit PreA